MYEQGSGAAATTLLHALWQRCTPIGDQLGTDSGGLEPKGPIKLEHAAPSKLRCRLQG